METKKEFVYLATPYSHDNPAIMQLRYEMVTAAAARLMEQGLVVYSPITHGRVIHHYLPDDPRYTGWEFWREIDFTFLSKASKMYVLTIDGWSESVGVAEEMDFCRLNGIPIYFLPFVYS